MDEALRCGMHFLADRVGFDPAIIGAGFAKEEKKPSKKRKKEFRRTVSGVTEELNELKNSETNDVKQENGSMDSPQCASTSGTSSERTLRSSISSEAGASATEQLVHDRDLHSSGSNETNNVRKLRSSVSVSERNERKKGSQDFDNSNDIKARKRCKTE